MTQDTSRPSQLRQAYLVAGFVLAAALALVSAWAHVRSGDVVGAQVDVEHAIDLAEKAESAQLGPVRDESDADTDTDTDGAR